MSPSVAVTGAQTRGGLAAIRDIGRGNIRVIGLDHKAVPFGLRSRWAEAYGRLASPATVDRILAALRETRADALLPTQSWIVRLVTSHLERVGREVEVNLPDPDAFRAAYDNRTTLAECRALGIPAPRLLEAPALGQITVVKPAADVGAAVGVAFCRDADAVARAVDACRPFGQPFLQEYIPGGVEAMRALSVVFDRQSRLVCWFTARKLQTRPAEGGVTTLGVSTYEPELMDLIEPFFAKWRWRGPAEVEFKIDPRDGLAKVIEINPRFPGYVGAIVECGLHMPRLAAQAIIGRAEPPGPYSVGRKFINPRMHLKGILDEVRISKNRVRTVARALRQGWDAPWIRLESLTDPLPSLGKMLIELEALRTGARAGPDPRDRFEQAAD